MQTRYIPVKQLNEGDSVDLYGDEYADPKRDPAGCLAYEYATVGRVEFESAECVAVSFEGFDVVGFPPDHVVAVVTQ